MSGHSHPRPNPPGHDHGACPASAPASVVARGVSLRLRDAMILNGLDFQLPATGMVTLIGPSGAGKSSLLRCLNALQPGWRGEITLSGRSIRAWPGGPDALRRHIGLIAQTPCVFPRSIYANVTFGLRGFLRRRRSHALAEACLRQAALWDEVRDRLHRPAVELSAGQQQRLCIARALAVGPRVLLLDEPTSSLDPRSKQLIEAALSRLAGSMPVLCVTHDLDQARRLGGRTIFMCNGRIIEQGETERFFARPQQIESREFLRWAVCECGGE